jgi:hypothetical protein
MKTITIDEYKEAMRSAVCPVCVCFTRDAQDPVRCAHEGSGQCTLFGHLDELVDSISGVHSGSIEPYVEALRRDVCSKCSHQDERGVCDLRDSRSVAPTWCVLNAYFNLVVGAVEDLQKSRGANLQ